MRRLSPNLLILVGLPSHIIPTAINGNWGYHTYHPPSKACITSDHPALSHWFHFFNSFLFRTPNLFFLSDNYVPGTKTSFENGSSIKIMFIPLYVLQTCACIALVGCFVFPSYWMQVKHPLNLGQTRHFTCCVWYSLPPRESNMLTSNKTLKPCYSFDLRFPVCSCYIPMDFRSSKSQGQVVFLWTFLPGIPLFCERKGNSWSNIYLVDSPPRKRITIDTFGRSKRDLYVKRSNSWICVTFSWKLCTINSI